MRVLCEMAAPFVANSAVDGDEVLKPFRGHVATCLKCQARAAAMSRTARELASMGSVRFTAPADLEWRVMSALEGDLAVAGNWHKPVAWGAAAVSMAAAIVVWRLLPRTT